MSLSASSRTPRTPAPRVLVVDDDGLMRSLLETVFTTAGFEVQLFASGTELLAHAELRTWALLLLDVKMPGMSGPELHRLLRERGCELPVIFLTGASDISIAVTAMHQGAVDFIEKPFSAQALVERAHKALADPKRQMQWR
ncbi:MAG: response regulator, partial [Rhizobacter sp.]|nr:response regulator [Rhizobacter sp.]